VSLAVVDASTLFLSRLSNIEHPEQKRKIIGNTFINIFEEELQLPRSRLQLGRRRKAPLQKGRLSGCCRNALS